MSDKASSVKVKLKKKSRIEWQSMTNLTERFTSPARPSHVTSTSRYCRAQPSKTEIDQKHILNKTYLQSTSPVKTKSPVKVIISPVYKMHASNSPVKGDLAQSTPKKVNPTESKQDHHINRVYSDSVSPEKKASSSKRSKLFIRKDLVQTNEKEETLMLIKNMFSPVPTEESNGKLNNAIVRSTEKYSWSDSAKKKSLNSNVISNSVVKALNFDGKNKKMEYISKSVLSKTEQFELEARCEYQVGDLAWARMGTYPFWPCIVTREPLTNLFVKRKMFGRIEREVIHVTFFGDNGRRSWIVDNMLRKFFGQLEFEATREHFSPMTKKKDPKLYAAFFVSEKKMPIWSLSVEEAETLLREPKRLRIDHFNDMLAHYPKGTVKQRKGENLNITTSEVSLSESLLDTLFSENTDKEESVDRCRSKIKNSLDVSEVVTACLDNMAAKTGITKIRRQSHMDRWLQKAKSNTPEKSLYNNVKETVKGKPNLNRRDKLKSEHIKIHYNLRNSNDLGQIKSDVDDTTATNTQITSKDQFDNLPCESLPEDYKVLNEFSAEEINLNETTGTENNSTISENIPIADGQNLDCSLEIENKNVDHAKDRDIKQEDIDNTKAFIIINEKSNNNVGKINADSLFKKYQNNKERNKKEDKSNKNVMENVTSLKENRMDFIDQIDDNNKSECNNIDVSRQDVSKNSTHSAESSHLTIISESSNLEQNADTTSNILNISPNYKFQDTENNTNTVISTIDKESSSVYISDDLVDEESIYSKETKIYNKSQVLTTNTLKKGNGNILHDLESSENKISTSGQREKEKLSVFKKDLNITHGIDYTLGVSDGEVSAESLSIHSDGNNESLPLFKCKLNSKNKLKTMSKIKNSEFIKYTELWQDALMDEHPDLSHDEIIEYMYKTWQYEKNCKFEVVKTDDIDQSILVTGPNDDLKRNSFKKLRLNNKRKQKEVLVSTDICDSSSSGNLKDKRIRLRKINDEYSTSDEHNQVRKTVNDLNSDQSGNIKDSRKRWFQESKSDTPEKSQVASNNVKETTKGKLSLNRRDKFKSENIKISYNLRNSNAPCPIKSDVDDVDATNKESVVDDADAINTQSAVDDTIQDSESLTYTQNYSMEQNKFSDKGMNLNKPTATENKIKISENICVENEINVDCSRKGETELNDVDHVKGKEIKQAEIDNANNAGIINIEKYNDSVGKEYSQSLLEEYHNSEEDLSNIKSRQTKQEWIKESRMNFMDQTGDNNQSEYIYDVSSKIEQNAKTTNIFEISHNCKLKDTEKNINTVMSTGNNEDNSVYMSEDLIVKESVYSKETKICNKSKEINIMNVDNNGFSQDLKSTINADVSKKNEILIRGDQTNKLKMLAYEKNESNIENGCDYRPDISDGELSAETVLIYSEDSNECLPRLKRKLCSKNKLKKKNNFEDPMFLKYMELRQDAVMDEHSELSQEEITEYVYQTWQYEENCKSEVVRTDDIKQSILVKGLNDDLRRKSFKKDRLNKKRKQKDNDNAIVSSETSDVSASRNLRIQVARLPKKITDEYSTSKENNSTLKKKINDFNDDPLTNFKKVSGQKWFQKAKLNTSEKSQLTFDKNEEKSYNLSLARRDKLQSGYIKKPYNLRNSNGSFSIKSDVDDTDTTNTDISTTNTEFVDNANTVNTQPTVKDTFQHLESPTYTQDYNMELNELIAEKNNLNKTTATEHKSIIPENISVENKIILDCSGRVEIEVNNVDHAKDKQIKQEEIDNSNKASIINIKNSNETVGKNDYEILLEKYRNNEESLSKKKFTRNIISLKETKINSIDQIDDNNKIKGNYKNDCKNVCRPVDNCQSVVHSADSSHVIINSESNKIQQNAEKTIDILEISQNCNSKDSDENINTVISTVNNEAIRRSACISEGLIVKESLYINKSKVMDTVTKDNDSISQNFNSLINADVSMKNEIPTSEDQSEIQKNLLSQINLENGLNHTSDVSDGEFSIDTLSKPSKDNSEPLSLLKGKLRQENKLKTKNSYDDPDFLKYMELRQDALMDEHPELTQEEITKYMYKTWQYEENCKSETVRTHDIEQYTLVKGLNNDLKPKPFKKRLPKNLTDEYSTSKENSPVRNTINDLNLSENVSKESYPCIENDSALKQTNEEIKLNKEDVKSVNTTMLISTKNAQRYFDIFRQQNSEESNCQKHVINDRVQIETDPEKLSDSAETKSLSKHRYRKQGDKQPISDKEHPEFIKYLELRQDSLIDDNPQLTKDEIVSYLFKTYQYEESVKSEIKKLDDIEQANLVKGLNSETPHSKKSRKKANKKRECSMDEDIIPKEKPKRKISQPYYNENISDLEDEIKLFETYKPNHQGLANADSDELSDLEPYIPPDEVERYFADLVRPKPNIFKGLIREKVCDICEGTGNLVKCRGCNCMFHVDCVRKENQVTEVPIPLKGRKKKKKFGRKPKNFDESESQSDEKSFDISEENNVSIEDVTESEPYILDAKSFEMMFESKMKELIPSLDAKYDSFASIGGLNWDNMSPGQCEIVDVTLYPKITPIDVDSSNFKCNNCKKYDIPVCFVCRQAISKTGVEYRQRCQTSQCNKYYHMKCLDHWPQTQFNAGEIIKNSKNINEKFDDFMCPRHVCHTCVSDDPRGCNTRFSGDKLTRCVRCPATYHTFTKCLPAGSQILTGSHILCPRHYNRPGKVPCHVNTGWCFICALGGSLICCEYCPTSFHAECLNIKPPEGGYMCEDCETGRLPLYGEMVWVKLGHYRWWPGLILHPSEIPENIMAATHYPGEFVVRFFGQYDYYWVNRGRVFPFQEGDSGRISSQKSKIDADFTTAMEHAQRACKVLKSAVKNEEEENDIASSLLPPHYIKLKVNKPVGSLCGKRVDIEENSLTQCDCNPDEDDPCGPYSQCLNRMLLTECGPTCRAGDRCNNRAFERRQYPKMAPYRASNRGWGLRALEDIRAGQFVIEYVGELIDEEEFRRRMNRKHEIRDENFYFLTLDKERMIDAGPKGNLARFMNHCCEPNCETQKWTVLGDVRVGLFAIKDIPSNSELTFNYNLECAGIEKKRCLCGAKRCSGYIGAKPKQDDTQPKKIKVPGTKRPYKKRKNAEESPSTSKNKTKKPLGRPPKPKELTEIEKDLLIIKRATNSISSDSESNSRLSANIKLPKRKRDEISADEVKPNTSSPTTKRAKLDQSKPSEVGD
ncbi:hypothetical protein ACJJTC_002177 [Scirpophaga incertulas]